MFSPKPRIKRNGYADTLSEEHFENSVTRRGTYILLELFIYVQIFEFFFS
jgi:hypothetical protein